MRTPELGQLARKQEPHREAQQPALGQCKAVQFQAESDSKQHPCEYGTAIICDAHAQQSVCPQPGCGQKAMAGVAPDFKGICMLWLQIDIHETVSPGATYSWQSQGPEFHMHGLFRT